MGLEVGPEGLGENRVRKIIRVAKNGEAERHAYTPGEVEMVGGRRVRLTSQGKVDKRLENHERKLDRIEALCAKKSRLVAELAKALGCNERYVANMIAELAQRGRGLWRVGPAGEPGRFMKG